MRQITVKYAGECRKCTASLNIGQQAIYEKHIGIFCVPCGPTDPEEIRQYRQEAGDRRADQYEEWADKREAKANTQLNSHPEMRHDWAFITQPGHIPMRARMNAADQRAFESLKVADRFHAKAESLRHVRVKGDAEKKYQAHREGLDSIIFKGCRIYDVVFGYGQVVGIFKKSCRVKWERTGNTYARDKMFLQLAKEQNVATK